MTYRGILYMMKPQFSVIIPALNEEQLLPRLMDSLVSQKYTNFEVIIVDANSTDRTVSIAQSYSDKFPLTIVHTAEHNISRSRNIGASKAKGTYFLFVDSDNYFDSDFLSRGHSALQKGHSLIVPALVPDSKKFIYRATFTFANFLVWIGGKLDIFFSTGGNLIIKASVFREVNGFDETIFVGEDHDIVERTHEKGFKIYFAADSKIIFSTRRLEKEGAAVLLKYFISTIYILFFGKITKKIYNYQMGGDYYRKKS